MNNLVGCYQLVKYGYQLKNKNEFKPISDFYNGVIFYTDTGQMSVIVRFAREPQALKEVVAYSGTYSVQNDEIVHQVTTSVRPDYEGQTLIRTFKIEGSLLTTEFENTDEFVKFAQWKRL